jgi:hypothetical protein
LAFQPSAAIDLVSHVVLPSLGGKYMLSPTVVVLLSELLLELHPKLKSKIDIKHRTFFMK